MHYLKTLIEEDHHMFIARQILLYLPLADLLECKRVNHAWNAHIQTLFRNEWTHWSNEQLAQKMSAAVSSVLAGSVVQKIHLNEKYEELTKQDYKLMKCYPFKGVICLQFSKILPNLRKYCFCVIAQDNIHNVRYASKFEGTLGSHFRLGDSFVLWWYVRDVEDNIKLSFRLLYGMPSSFFESSCEKTIPLSQFITPRVAYHEIISGESNLRFDIKKQFPDLSLHTQFFLPTTAIAIALRCGYHEIYYYEKPSHESLKIWVLDTNTMKVEIKRSTTKCSWICNGYALERIYLRCYRHPFAIFFIQVSNMFAVWDLSQPGFPRHINFNIQLPLLPWTSIESQMTKSKWIFQLFNADKSNFIYMDMPSLCMLNNSPTSCNCNNQKSKRNQKCNLEENMLMLQASQSSHTSKTYAYFIGERFVIEGTSQPPKVHMRDCWKL